MKGFLRRLRGIIGTGLIWAVGWAGLYCVSVLLKLAFGVEIPWDLLPLLWQGSLHVGVEGFVAGSVFGVLLSVLERHTKLEDLSFRRIAVWGGIGGLAFAVTLGPAYLQPVIFFTLMGVGSATGAVALAKRGSEPKLIEGDDEPLPALEGE
jgi:hypothetical protein